MAVEGGGAYRNRLVRRQALVQNKTRKQRKPVRGPVNNPRASEGPSVQQARTAPSPAFMDRTRIMPSASGGLMNTTPDEDAFIEEVRSANRFAAQGVTGRDSTPDTIFEGVTRFGVESAVDTAKSYGQIANELANKTNPATVFLSEDWVARGAGNIIGLADSNAGEQAKKSLSGRVTTEDILNASDVFAPGVGKVVKAGVKGIKYAPDFYRGFARVAQQNRAVADGGVEAVLGGVRGSKEAIEKLSATNLENDPLTAVDSALTLVANNSRVKTLLPKLEDELQTLYTERGFDPAGWDEDTTTLIRGLQDDIKYETDIFREDFAQTVETVQKNKERGIPVDETLSNIGIKDAKFGWMLKYIDPEKIREAKDVPHTLEGFTHTVEEMKKKIYNTLKQGRDRQIKKIEKGNTSITAVDEVPYESWRDVPDEVIDALIQVYGKDKATGVRDKRTGKVVNLFTVAWDHINALDKGGENDVEKNYQALIGILNSIKSSL